MPAPYEGRPWFLPFAGEWFRLQDRLAARSRASHSWRAAAHVAPHRRETVMTDTADLLAGVPLLSGLDQKHLERLARDFTERTFPAGTVVVRQGDEHGMGFFVVAEGEGVVTVDGKEVGTVGPGSYFGEVALISDRVRTATVTATTDLRVPGHDAVGLPRLRPGRCRGRLEAARARRRDAAQPATDLPATAAARQPRGAAACRAGGRCRPRSRGS